MRSYITLVPARLLSGRNLKPFKFDVVFRIQKLSVRLPVEGERRSFVVEADGRALALRRLVCGNLQFVVGVDDYQTQAFQTGKYVGPSYIPGKGVHRGRGREGAGSDGLFFDDVQRRRD